MKYLGFSIAIATFLITLGFVSESFALPSKKHPPSLIAVNYGIHIEKLSVDFKESRFHAEFYWWADFVNDSSVTHITNDDIIQFMYVNGIDFEIDDIKKEVLDIQQNGNTFHYVGFHHGDFYFKPDYTMYPFDDQVLEILIENSQFNDHELQLISDNQSYIYSKQQSHLFGISDDILQQNEKGYYKISKSEITAKKGVYNTNFGIRSSPSITAFSRLNFTIHINRSILPYISKLIIPLIIILLLVYFVFFLPADRLDIAAGLTVTSLLSAIAFETAINENIQEIGYIIYLDKVFYTCYFLIAMAMAQSLIKYYWGDSPYDEDRIRVKSIDTIFRILFPMVFFGAIILFAL